MPSNDDTIQKLTAQIADQKKELEHLKRQILSLTEQANDYKKDLLKKKTEHQRQIHEIQAMSQQSEADKNRLIKLESSLEELENTIKIFDKIRNKITTLEQEIKPSLEADKLLSSEADAFFKKGNSEIVKKYSKKTTNNPK